MFSVIMPLYNKRDTILESVASVLNQTFQEFELIIVDDGSTDGSADLVKDVQDKRIHLYRKANGGVSAARNDGIERATREYICFLDADDIWETNHLQTLKELIDSVPDCGIYSTCFRQENNDGSSYSPNLGLEHILVVDDIFEIELQHKTVLHTNSICIKKNIIRDAGGFIIGERIGEDTSLWYRIAAFHAVAIINRVTTIYRMKYSSAINMHGFINRNWSFLRYYEERIKESDVIPGRKKKNIALFINSYRHSIVRHELLGGKRKEAFVDMRKVSLTLSECTEYAITLACFLIPRKQLLRIYTRRGIMR